VTAVADADRVFAALADPRRRELLELLGRTPGCSASSLAARLPVSRQAVAQHLAVLVDSSLVSRRRAGREVLFSVRPEGLTATADWLTGRAAAWRDRLESLKREAEAGNRLPACQDATKTAPRRRRDGTRRRHSGAATAPRGKSPSSAG
jgi:DNA-binding transcriptional ArsR family regulator